jgi:hypothetical protein
MKRLPRLSKPGILTPAEWNGVAKVIEDNFREVALQPGVGYTLKNSPGGSSLYIAPGAGSQKKQRQPLDIMLEGDPSNPAGYLASIVPGTINGILPSNITNGGNLAKFAISDAFTYFTLHLVSNGKVLTAASIQTSTTAPDPPTYSVNAAPATYDYLFGVTYKGAVQRIIGLGSPTLTPTIVQIVPKSSATPGMRSFDNYYLWQ